MFLLWAHRRVAQRSAWLRAHPVVPQCVEPEYSLLDFVLPWFNGLQRCAWIRVTCFWTEKMPWKETAAREPARVQAHFTRSLKESWKRDFQRDGLLSSRGERWHSCGRRRAQDSSVLALAPADISPGFALSAVGCN